MRVRLSDDHELPPPRPASLGTRLVRGVVFTLVLALAGFLAWLRYSVDEPPAPPRAVVPTAPPPRPVQPAFPR